VACNAKRPRKPEPEEPDEEPEEDTLDDDEDDDVDVDDEAVIARLAEKNVRAYLNLFRATSFNCGRQSICRAGM
jgi:hypothetical protein